MKLYPPDSSPADPRPVVLHLLHTLQRAGAEVLVRDLVRDLKNEFRSIVVALDGAGPLESDFRALQVPVHVLDRRGGIDWRCAWNLARIIRQSRVDIIHAHQYTPLSYAAMARMLGSGATRLIFTEHGRHYPDQRRFKRVAANRLALIPMCDAITAVGHAVAEALTRFESIPADRIQVIHNGIDPDRLVVSNPLQTRIDLRRSLAISADEPVILQVGSLRPVKDHLVSLHAMAELRRRNYRTTLLLAGDGPLRDQLIHLTHRLEISESVRFLGSRCDVASLWQAADVGLLTSRSEGISVALLEAMAAGKPIVATDVGGNSEIVQHQITGLLIPPGQPTAAAQALHRILTDDSLATALGQTGAQRVTDHFHQSQMHAAYRQLYRRLSPPTVAVPFGDKKVA